jgi:hypothetical protein
LTLLVSASTGILRRLSFLQAIEISWGDDFTIKDGVDAADF